ncbi:uncharacterized protein FTJAE_3005 [Fusarium tjaetaba]|uniref:F-box domain-containing protein n=1 Tax=Fusarium tjaetaba TaxID=1567544 RepID=A0A8H5S3H8_9HYPO|nr:uncharacterized protein FTJAE_3005 [Fusarium tjaetaba]KAF5643935.1 hypothetical protein FTJAE_3005 [Fusarium tjaetaba]
MEKLPQECRDMVTSFLDGYDVKNLVLVSKSYQDFFAPRNLRRLWFEGLPRLLSHQFTHFLAMKPSKKFSLIRKISVILQKRGRVGTQPPLYEKLGPLLVNSVSQVTELQELDLSLGGWPQEQEKNLCELLMRTRKWDKLNSLKISTSPEILCAVLSRCVPEILEAVNIDGHYGTRMYNELVRLCSSSKTKHSLKKLTISPNFDGPLLDKDIILEVITHFKALKCLSIQGRSDLWDTCWTTAVFSGSLSIVCDLLNQTYIEELCLSMPYIPFDRASVLEYLNGPVPDLVESEDVTESELERAYRKLIADITSACRRIRKIVILQKFETRFDVVGFSSPGRVIEVKLC